MTRHVKFVVCLIAMLCMEVALSHFAATQTSQSVTVGSTAAYVYVSSNPSGSKNQINAYSAAPDGKLTPVTGSPFSAASGYGASLAVTAKYLFSANEVDINSYSIASNGALSRVGTIDAQGFNQSDCGGPVSLFLDRSGATLYDEDIYSDCANNAYQFFDTATLQGKLSYLGTTARTTPEFEVPLNFLGDNKYAYGASCYHWYQEIFGFLRNSDGALTSLAINPAMPVAQDGSFYCPYLASTDLTNHLAVPVQPLNNSEFQPDGAYQLAVYTADSSGNLSTKSTYSNMPKVAVGTVSSISVSPSGKLLAIAGTAGLQVFHFNGASPITHYTGLLNGDNISQVSWDNDNHLYAISPSSGKLLVFTVTTTKYCEVSGSPFTITKPQALAVLSR
jgi:WD40 repeat protein